MTGAELHLFTARWLLSCAKTKRRAGLPDGAAFAIHGALTMRRRWHDARRMELGLFAPEVLL